MEVRFSKSRLLHLNLLVFMLYLMQLSSGSDSIFPGQTLSGNHTLNSKGGTFEMGLFSPGNSHNCYLGIWYRGLPLPNKTVVWVANRENPVSDPSSSLLEFSEDGNLVLLSSAGHTVWSTNLASGSGMPNSRVAVLGDDGNLLIRDKSDIFNVSWQSFSYPTDTWLPGALFGCNAKNTVLTSWKDENNPAPGGFSAETIGRFESLLLNNGSNIYWSSKSEWFYSKDTLVSYADSNVTYHTSTHSGSIRYVLDVDGVFKQFVWWKDFQRWNLILRQPLEESDSCCGNFSVCNFDFCSCTCIPGFVPSNRSKWDMGIYEGGCVRKTPLHCTKGKKDVFSMIPNIRYPNGAEFFEVNDSGQCQLACLRNCPCSGYAYNYTCLIWTTPWLSLRHHSSDEEIGGSIYVRVAASEFPEHKNKTKRSPWIVVGAVTMLLSLSGICIALKILWKEVAGDSFEAMGDTLILFKYRDLCKATKNFREKLGQGGFSTIYKGEFPNSTFVAVKELRGLMQDEKQLRAELSTIGVIQHRNLVRLRGFCLEGSKRFLVYDYMPNGSLESHLFLQGFRFLAWRTRYSIAIGAAKGLAYLHEECRDCIMHFDIKPENILLDADYTPKVADFGLAKLLCRNSSRVLTTMRGTRGYLAPEWFSGEPVSAKVDVYSYGMVLFEIISGRRNMDMVDNELSNFFPALVSNALNNGEEVLTLVDHQLEETVNAEELSRACKVACWCIQDNEKDRPTMMQVVRILEGTVDVGIPPIPRFFQSLAEGYTKSVDVEESEDYSSSTSSLPASFRFPSLVHPTEHNL